MRNKANQTNIDKSDLTNFPNGRIKNNTGAGNGTPINEVTKGDIHEFFDKALRLYGITHNDLPDNETNGYQTIDAVRALASKNDFVLDLTVQSGVMKVPVKISKMLENESIILKATFNKGSETQIGSTLETGNKVVSFIGDFKTNEYVRMINTSASVVLIRMVDAVNIDTVVSDLLYLKAATQIEEDAGETDEKATTPLTNKTVFEKRVNGDDSDNFLAIATSDLNPRNGLLSSSDAEKIKNLADPSGLIQITGDSYVTVNSPAGGALEGNFNFNYIDVTPPTGKTMANLRGFMASTAFSEQNPSNPDSFWCRWQIQATKIRVICGDGEYRGNPPKVNWMAIWI